MSDLWTAVGVVAVRHVAEVNHFADEYLDGRDRIEHARGGIVVEQRPDQHGNRIWCSIGRFHATFNRRLDRWGMTTASNG